MHASRDAKYTHDGGLGCSDRDTRMELVEDELAGSLVDGASANLTDVRCVRGLVGEDPKEAYEVGVQYTKGINDADAFIALLLCSRGLHKAPDEEGSL